MTTRTIGTHLLAFCLALAGALGTASAADDGWITLFDGSSLDGWRASETKDTFQLRDGMLIANGKRSHLFYVGDINGGKFQNFELKVDVKTKHNSNGGIYFHTAYQEVGWPDKGFEVQVNNTYKDPRKTGSLYAVSDIAEAPARDGEWFTEHIIVQGKKVTIKVDGKTVIEWTEPDDWPGLIDPANGQNFPQRKVDSGTFALQGHDPGSTIYYRNIRVKPLP